MGWWPLRSAIGALAMLSIGAISVSGESVTKPAKRVIGSTATLTEVSSGLPFEARVDTGAKSCSLHVEKWEIQDPRRMPVENVGKPIRFLIKNHDGESEWVESKIAGRVRIKNAVNKDGDTQGRYKVRLKLKWKDFEKDVLVTLTDRGEMDYPLLIGRNFLRGDFIVDVDKDSDDT